MKWNGDSTGKKEKNDSGPNIQRILWPSIWGDLFTDCGTKLWTSFPILNKKLNRVSLQLMRNNPKIIECQSCKFQQTENVGHKTVKENCRIMSWNNESKTLWLSKELTIFWNNSICSISMDLIQIEHLRLG